MRRHHFADHVYKSEGWYNDLTASNSTNLAFYGWFTLPKWKKIVDLPVATCKFCITKPNNFQMNNNRKARQQVKNQMIVCPLLEKLRQAMRNFLKQNNRRREYTWQPALSHLQYNLRENFLTTQRTDKPHSIRNRSWNVNFGSSEFVWYFSQREWLMVKTWQRKGVEGLQWK